MWDWLSYSYYFIAMTLSFLLLNNYDNSKGDHSVKLALGILPIFLLMGLRGPEVGNDLIRYNDNIVLIDEKSDGIHLLTLSEPIFTLIYKLSNICGGLHFFIIFTSFLQALFVFNTCKILHKNGFQVALIVLLFYGALSIRSFSMVRNGLAVAVSFCAYASLIERNNFKIKFWALTCLAIGIHNTALVNIAVYFICSPFEYKSKQQIRKEILWRCLLLFGVTAILFVLAKSQIMDLLQTVNDGKYSSFQETEKKSGLGNLLIRIPLLFLMLIHLKLLRSTYKNNFLPFLMLMFLDVSVAQMKYISQNFERFTMFSQIGEIVMIGLLMQALTKKYGSQFKIISYLIGIIYATYFLYYWSVFGGLGAGSGNMPYKFW